MALAACAIVAAGGCSSGRGTAGPMTLAPVSATLRLMPNDQQPITFLLTRGGIPAAGQTVSFALEPASPGGATLASPTGATGTDGTVSALVRAGLAADFRVRAQIGDAQAEVTVIVESGPTDAVLVAPYLAPSTSPPPVGAFTRVLFYDATSCVDLDLGQAPDPVRVTIDLADAGDTARFDFVSTTGVSAAVGRVMVESTVVAQGCVDIPGSSLQSDQTVEVALPLYDAVPVPIGTYAVTSTLTFAPPLAAASAIAVPWADLSDCPLDPAQLWLDCTIDALSPATDTDPLDCVPATDPGAEGALGDAITALRGAPLVDGTGAATGCRGPRDAAGDVSLDAQALGLFGSPLPAAVVALPAVAADAATLLNSLQLSSTLVVAAAGVAGSYVVTHTLDSAQLGPSSPVSVPLASLGLPVLQAITTGTVTDDLLTIGKHGFTLRFGTVARAAFGPLALVPRGLPADIPSFVTALFALARGPGGMAMGCDALDALVCPAISQPSGCLTAACPAGLQALAARLELGFDAANGTGLDLSLGGSARLVDTHGDGLAGALGGDGTSAPVAVWSATLRTAVGSAQLSAPFNGVRE